MISSQIWTGVGSLLAVWALFKQYFPSDIGHIFEKYGHKLVSFFYPYVQITFHEYSGNGFERGTAYIAIQRYLAANSSVTARKMKAESVKDTETLVLSMDDHEEITDEYQGIRVWWASSMTMPQRQSISVYPREDEKRFYTLSFHKKYRDVIYKSYLSHVLAEGKLIAVKNRQRKLYTNNKNEKWSRYGRSTTMWSHVVFEHPASFETLALEPKMKKDIMNDLITFSKSKDYYAKVGKAWKRGYLLYGPPGTGKSTMIAAMANLLQYDVYDLELTSVKDNTELRKLLIDTAGKSIIVIEDIDCSLDLTGQRKKKEEGETKDEKDAVQKAVENAGTDGSKVTLSGLLNFIDGLWSACGGERVIVFTTNYLEKLDPALIRRGRMDKHIEMSYCSFEAFKVLAKNYLDIESHELFRRIEELLGETDITPADIAENLMPKSAEENGESCLNCVIRAIEDAKVAAAKAKEEEKLKAEEKEKLKAEKEETPKQKVVEESTASKDGKENGALVI